MPAHQTVPTFETLDDLLDSLGGVSPKRVRLMPPPGTATEKDVIRLYEKHKRLFELVDGTLVEKVVGAKESFVAIRLAIILGNWNDGHGNLGMILGEAGTIKLLGKLVRIPDLSFTRWERLPNRKVPNEPIPDLAPDLAVEVLSKGNTKREMQRKLKEYFLSGVRLVWFVNQEDRAVRVHTSPDRSNEVGPDDTLDGGEVLPGFRVPVARLFAELDDAPAPKRKAPKRKQK
jgi:Uma2 family endonuclease